MELLKLLISRQIKFAVSGGVAYSVYARARYTADIDIVLFPKKENIQSFIQVFEEFGFPLKSHDPQQFIEERILLRVGAEPSIVDVMNFFDGVPMNELFEKVEHITLEDLAIPFVSREHLILNKLEVGRPRDIADVEELRKIIDFEMK